MTSGSKESAKFKLSDVVGQTSAATFAAKGYVIQSGFLNAAAGDTFLFTVSPVLVDFGQIYPENFVERKVKITIGNGNTHGYNVKVAQNEPLSTSLGAQIPDTACDALKDSVCTPVGSAKWKEITSYGLGYQMSGNTVPKDFSKNDGYRPFAALTRNEKSVTIMESTAKKTVDQAAMNLRVNIAKQQPVGIYRNTINFTAIAGI